ncbi:C-terminal processing protease CtpA/Prc [Rhabdobacter roseus]|uniref:C-terminal processing protease CtpA/Prc n=1 Tax=Rhabdobacter roseus TaxID=1655419 RepID=A0A840TQD8_9BACT|nr:S41 family peptidase [Rhabdobacter roseus]MBB5286051.1 C-terminal processing protease CtpA/Prc [Rhabdobacter roseus]
MNTTRQKITLPGFLFLLLSLAACQRPEVEPTPEEALDQMYSYVQDLYIWYDRLPSAAELAPRSLADPNALVAKVRTYSPLTTSGAHVDRWSYVTTTQNYQNQQQGKVTGRFGFGYSYLTDTLTYVRFVLPGSPLDLAGVKRGWRIYSVNGIAATVANAPRVTAALAESQAVEFRFVRPDGTSQTSSLARADFTTSPILTYRVLEVNGRKLGYVAVNEFTNKLETDILTVFQAFKDQGGISDLVVDLRYNGGGTIKSATQLASIIAPPSALNKKFFEYVYNDKNTKRNTTVNLSPVNGGATSWGLSRVFFITTVGTASASEMLINGLQPYLKTITVGTRTHGKPVGMVGGTIGQHIIFPISFRTVNANGDGDYFEGIPVDKEQFDDLTHDFGDPQEACLADVLNYLRTGTLPARKSARLGQSAAVERANQQLYEEPRLKGALDF